MEKITSLGGKTYRHFIHDSLYRNSIFLLLAGLVNGGFSFIFWILAAHLYTQAQVGQATALIAAVGLVAGFGTLGFNNSIIRFLPRAQDKNLLLNGALTIVASAALLASIIFLILLPHISPALIFVRQHVWYTLIFMVFVISTATNTILDNTFTAYRSTHFTFIKNIIINIFELWFVIAFLRLGSIGIFASYGLAFFMIALIGIAILIKKFDYLPKPSFNKEILRETAKFSLANYVVSYLNGLPGLVLPIVVTNLLGAKLNAVYYIAYSVASLLFIIPLGIGNALFAEGAHDATNLKHTIKRTARITTLLMVPAIFIIAGLAPVILFFFGKHYSAQGVAILRILALSAVFLAVCYPCGSILNIMQRLKSLIIVNFLGAVVVIGTVYTFIKGGHGLVGVAWGWLLGWAVYALLYVLAVARALASTSSTTA